MNQTNLIAYIGAGLVGAGLIVAALVLMDGDNTASASRAEPGMPAMAASAAPPMDEAAALVTANEAEAWAQARAADSTDAYKVYLAAYPEGAFRTEAIDRLAEADAPPAAAPPARVRTIVQTASAPAPRRNVAAECRAYVDQQLSAPNRTYRTVGGAAAGCAVGAMAGGDDGRNCVVGAIVGAGAGAISAESRERRRLREVEYCIANGGPPR